MPTAAPDAIRPHSLPVESPTKWLDWKSQTRSQNRGVRPAIATKELANHNENGHSLTTR
ncbi:hypothetical protein SBA4_3840007 [Candidatus Sulfopaludibacter sp. SbA4]|nr:hypothetical protein SBA4_3840007 [Candidatus Sulfopaludibacter sp. SbA4]